MENNKKNIININPPLSIYNIFENLSYTLDSAFAEFIDNSTQAYKDNKDLIKNKIPFFVPKVYIIYYADKGEEAIQIIDNCFGIRNQELDRVLKLNIKPKNLDLSRNEYGMGLKTSAFWLGNKLSIFSKCLTENYSTNIFLSLNEIKENIPINYGEEYSFQEKFGFECGTSLEITSLHKQNIPKNQQLIKLGKIFASKYRFDIEEEKLEIYIIKHEKGKTYTLSNNNVVEIDNLNEAVKINFYKEKFKIDEKTGKEQKITISDYLEFEGEKYYISGEIGILSKGSRNNAGLILFRRQRSIIGDEEGKRYKPYKIFKDGGSFEYQRIYGWLNLDDFPVFQAKNGFRWENGLENAFIDFIYEKITCEELNIVKIAKNIRSKISDLELFNINNEETAKELEESINTDSNDINVHINYKHNDSSFDIKFYEYEFREININFHVIKGGKNNDKWLTIKKNNNKVTEVYEVILDLDTEFFSPFNNDEDNVKNQIMKFCVYFAYSEIRHSAICGNSSHQREILNKLLRGEIKNDSK